MHIKTGEPTELQGRNPRGSTQRGFGGLDQQSKCGVTAPRGVLIGEDAKVYLSLDPMISFGLSLSLSLFLYR